MCNTLVILDLSYILIQSGYSIQILTVLYQHKHPISDPCPSGSELPPTGLNEADCIPCNKGWYKKKGETTVCVQCSPNKTTRNNGSSQAEDCICMLPALFHKLTLYQTTKIWM